MTPELATAWLELNKENRTFRETRALSFARDMLAGHWDSRVGDHILFVTEDGLLGNGQHRLGAVEVAGKIDPNFEGVWFYVNNVPRSTLRKVDLATRRNVRDYLQFEGVKLNALQATIAGRVVRMDAGYPPVGSSRFTPTNEEIYDAIQNPQVAQRVLRAASVGTKVRRSKLPHRAGVVGIAYYACSLIDEAAADEFFVKQLAENLGLEEDFPAAALQRRLRNQRRGSDVELWNYTIHAWNHFRAGGRLKKLVPPDSWGPNGYAIPN